MPKKFMRKFYSASTSFIVCLGLINSLTVLVAIGLVQSLAFLVIGGALLTAIGLHIYLLLRGWRIKDRLLRNLSRAYVVIGNLVLLLALLIVFWLVVAVDICQPGGGDIVIFFPFIILFMPLIGLSCSLGAAGKLLLWAATITCAVMVVFKTIYMWGYPVAMGEDKEQFEE